MIITYYTRLGISENATDEEVKKAYRKKVLAYHPDTTSSNPKVANEEFLKIQKAYECLSDPIRRKKYDADLYIYRNTLKNNHSNSQEQHSHQYNKEQTRSKGCGIKFFLMFIVALLLYHITLDPSGPQLFSRDSKPSDDTLITKTSLDLANRLETGDAPYEYFYGYKYDNKSLSSITFHNGQSVDAVVLLCDVSNNRIIRNVYIRAGEIYECSRIPEGRYRLRTYSGIGWDSSQSATNTSPKGKFISQESFSTSTEVDDFIIKKEYTNEGISYPSYTVTLHEVINGNMQTKKINKNDFF